jgi:hypothetical protein
VERERERERERGGESNRCHINKENITPQHNIFCFVSFSLIRNVYHGWQKKFPILERNFTLNFIVYIKHIYANISGFIVLLSLSKHFNKLLGRKSLQQDR